jgi:N-acetylglucosaminyldiphosphoundecaprenol N-acetyl-beta-D-mannosaminyltransferase
METAADPIVEPTVSILGSRVHLLSTTRTVEFIESWIRLRDGECRQIVATGFHGLLEASRNEKVHAVLNQAELWVPDGIAPVWIARLRGHREAVRSPGPEIFAEFLNRANLNGNSSYFFGDTEHTLAALTEAVKAKYPGHRVAGSFSPPFRPLTPAEDQDIIDRINDAQPDVLWVALGLPKQDIWIHERLSRLKVPVAVGVGAAFAFIAGTVPRCPEWIGRAGFEWVFRLLAEPKKLWRRDFFDGPLFIYQAGLELFRNEPSTDRRPINPA